MKWFVGVIVLVAVMAVLLLSLPEAFCFLGDSALRAPMPSGEIDRKQDPQLAISYYDKALNINPKNVTALLSRAEAYSVIDKNQLASEDLKRVIDVDPQCAPAYFDLALVDEKLGNKSGALSELGKYLTLGAPESFKVSNYFGRRPFNAYEVAFRILNDEKNVDSASEWLMAEAARDTKTKMPYWCRARLFAAKRRWNDAAADLSRCLESKGTSRDELPISRLQMCRAEAYYELGKYKESYEDYCAACVMNKRLLLEAGTLANSGNYQKACDKFRHPGVSYW